MNTPATTIERPAKERPILFSAPMIRAILDGRKTQTRRLVGHDVMHRPDGGRAAKWYIRARRDGIWDSYETMLELVARHCPYGVPGDRLWVRETHAIVPATAYRCSREPDGSQVAHRVSPDGLDWAVYREGWTRTAPRPWRPSIHMPRWASRISLEVTDVRVERLQAISEEDARAEGVVPYTTNTLRMVDPDARGPRFRPAFIELWDAINGTGSWASNPWVWVVSFRRVEGER